MNRIHEAYGWKNHTNPLRKQRWSDHNKAQHSRVDILWDKMNTSFSFDDIDVAYLTCCNLFIIVVKHPNLERYNKDGQQPDKLC